MKFRPLIAAVLATGFAWPVLAQSAPGVSEQEAQQAAHSSARQFDAAWNAEDPAGVASLFADNGIYITPGGSMLASRQAMEKAVAGRIQAGWTKQTTRITESHAVGESVWFVGEYTLTGAGEVNGKRFGGYVAEVLMRQGSEWRIHLLIGNRGPTQEAAATPGTALPK